MTNGSIDIANNDIAYLMSIWIDKVSTRSATNASEKPIFERIPAANELGVKEDWECMNEPGKTLVVGNWNVLIIHAEMKTQHCVGLM